MPDLVLLCRCSETLWYRMDSPSTQQYTDDTHTMAFRVLTVTVVFTLAAILWHNNFIGCIYRLLVLFKVGSY